MLSEKEKYIELFKNSINSFVNVSDETFEQLVKIGKFKSVGKRELIILKEQIAKKIYFVCKGILISKWIDHEGNVHIKNFFIEGNLAGSTVSMLQQTPSAFSIESITEGVIIEMDYQQYKTLIFNSEELKNFYIAYLEQKWVIENEKRQISFAAQSATERYLTFQNDFPGLENRVAQHIIALYLGITPTQLSRIRKKL